MTTTTPSAPPQPPPGPWLVADIGGTHARFGWVAATGGEVAQVAKLSVTAFAGPGEAALAYLGRLRDSLGAAWQPPRAGAFALATALDGDHVELTNSGWAFSRAAVQRTLALDSLLLLNDFEALALSLPRLQPAQMRPVGALPPKQPPRATLAVIGPGTGLGVAGLVPTRHGWVALPGEGGHATLAAGDDFEAALLATVRRRHAHVSAERLLSGIGLPLLHAAVAEVLGQAAAPLESRQIVERALAQQDALASRTVDSFCALLGGFAGNVALVLGARGGVYVGGGIVPRLGDHFAASRFRERFEAKGRFEDYLRTIPTAVVTDTLAALGGAALALEQSAT